MDKRMDLEDFTMTFAEVEDHLARIIELLADWTNKCGVRQELRKLQVSEARLEQANRLRLYARAQPDRIVVTKLAIEALGATTWRIGYAELQDTGELRPVDHGRWKLHETVVTIHDSDGQTLTYHFPKLRQG